MKHSALCRLRIAASSAMTIAIMIGISPSIALASKGKSCEELIDLGLKDTVIEAAESVPAGSFLPPGSSAPITDLPAFCRVAGSIHPTDDSDIKFEVWMPSSDWNKKFLSAGEGGWAGSINYGGIAQALQRGYAGGSSDTGHVGGNADFAPGHPEKVIDFGWRGKHLQAVKSKQIIAAFYGRAVRHSYFSSCSNGGRQAMMEIQRFPSDYDGVIVGAPAHDWTHLFTGFVWNEQAAWSEEGASLSPGKLATIQAETLKTCDAKDGVEDGVAEDPRRCDFDPATLLCPKGVDDDSCLTQRQIETTMKIMQGPQRSGSWRHHRHGGKNREIFPGYFTSAAADPGTWPLWVVGPAAGASVQAFFGNSFFGRVIEEIPAPGVWDFNELNFNEDIKAADKKIAGTFNATNPDLRHFARHNPRGKIIIWHGWEDPAISAPSTIDYYNAVQKKTRNAGKFTRLFLAPGMAHCGGGPGPNSFGQNLPQATPLSDSPKHDILSALERWVEKGKPPKKIIAAKYVDNDPSQGVERTRPLCPYPLVARYKGHGSTDEASNFRCKRQKSHSHKHK